MPTTRSPKAADPARRLQPAAPPPPKPATVKAKAVTADAFVGGSRPGANNSSVPVDANGVPLKAEDLPKVFPEFAKVKAEDLPALHQNLKTITGSGPYSEKAKALAKVSEATPDTVKTTLAKLHITDGKVLTLASNAKALDAIGTLYDPQSGVGEKAAAALALANNAGETTGAGDLRELLTGALEKHPNGSKLVEAALTFVDPETSGLDKAKSTLELAKALKDFAGKDTVKLMNDLRKLDGPMKAIGAGLTLLDGDAELSEKAVALAQLSSEVPELAKDLKGAASVLKNFGIKRADEIAQRGAAAANVAVKGLDPAVAQKLTPDQLTKLKGVAEKVGPEELEKVLKGVTDKASLEGLMGKLDGLDAAAGKKLLGVAAELEHGTLEAALKNPQLLESLTSLAGKLDDEGVESAAKLLSNVDAAGLKDLLKFTDQVGADTIKATLKTLEPVMENGGGKLVVKGLNLLEGTLGKMGVKLTKEVAEKALKNIAKVIPLAGAVPSVIDAAKYTKEAAELRSKNKDLGYFAVVGAGLNTADAVVGTVLDLTGVGAAIDVPVGMAFAAGELAIDIAFDNEKAKLEADPKNYQAPGWMKAVNLAFAASTGPAGLTSLAAYYGPEDGAQLVQWGVETGAKGAVELGKYAGVSSAEAAGDSLKLAGGMMHAAADVLRNPGKYGQAAVRQAQETFDAAIAKGGELAKAAKETIQGVVADAKKLGVKGLETLKYIAQHPGETAKAALDGIKSVVSQGVDLAKAGGKELYKKAVETLQSVKDGYESLKGAAKEKAKELIASAKAGINQAIDTAVKAGKDGIELLTWAATHPGDIAAAGKKALVETVQKGGELAQAAWTGIKSMGEKGKAIAQQAIADLKDAGAKGVETLKYIIKNPGAAATQVKEWAGRALTDMAKKTGEAAKAAAGGIKEFIDNRVEWANKFGRELLQSGSAAFKEVAQAWKTNLSEGGKAFLSGLKDLGDAGVDLLKDVASWGGQLAQQGVAELKDLAARGSRIASNAISGLRSAGNEAARYATQAFNSVANYDVKVFGWDITPWN